jgi:hypothetical protein
MDPAPDEPALVAAILAGSPLGSRNRHFELMSSEVGRRARRRAAFLRSLAGDIERLRAARGVVTIERGEFARAPVRVVLHLATFTRRAYLTDDEVALMTRAFPFVAGVFDVGTHNQGDVQE